MPPRKFQIRISGFCRLLYRQDQDEQARREHSPDDFDLALLDEAGIDGVAGFLAERTGMTFGECWEYVVRAGCGCQWGKWNRPNAEELRDITHIARAVSDHFRGDAMEELVAWFVEKAPLRAAGIGLTCSTRESMAVEPQQAPLPSAAPAQSDEAVMPEADPLNPKGRYAFRSDGDRWELKFGTEEGSFSDSKGWQRIRELLKQPHTAISGLMLCVGNTRCETLTHSRDKAFDRDAAAEYHETLQELKEAITAAKENSDDAQLDSYSKKKEDLLRQMTLDKRLRGGSRSLGPNSAPKKAVLAAHASIRDAIKKLRNAERPLTGMADYLRQHIKIDGNSIIYRPTLPAPTWIF